MRTYLKFKQRAEMFPYSMSRKKKTKDEKQQPKGKEQSKQFISHLFIVWLYKYEKRDADLIKTGSGR